MLGDGPPQEVSDIAEQEMKRLNIHIDLELHNAFKAATAARGENMTDILLKFIEDYVARYRYGTRPKKERRK
jgi:hypothetical protein